MSGVDVVKVVLFNRRAKFIGPYPRQILQKYFRFHPPNYFFMRMYRSFDDDGNRRWDGYVNLLKYRRVGTGLFLTLKDKIEKEQRIKFIVRDRRRIPRFTPIDLTGSRPYQTSCVESMQESVSGGIILAATRIGKTRIAGMFLKSMSGSGVFVVDELTLMEQARKELEEVIGEKIGTIGDTKFRPRRITVATIQTMHLHSGEKLTQLEKKKGYKPSPFAKEYEEWSQSLKCIFLDELHVQLNHRSFSVVEELKPRMVFGMTATLELKKIAVRLKAINLCGPVIFDYGLEKGTAQGFLTPGVAVSVGVRQEDHELFNYREAYNDLIVNSKERNLVITNLVKECHKQGRSIILLTERVKHLKLLSRQLKDIPHEIVYGAKEVGERLAAIKAFDKGSLRLILTNKVFKKGITIKSVDTMVDCAAMKSKNDTVQKFGRGIGLCKGKKGLIYFDVSDRSLEGLTREHQNWNRFNKATVSRLKALRAKGITVVKLTVLEMCFGSRGILTKAEQLLEKEIKRVEEERTKKSGVRGRNKNES